MLKKIIHVIRYKFDKEYHYRYNRQFKWNQIVRAMNSIQ